MKKTPNGSPGDRHPSKRPGNDRFPKPGRLAGPRATARTAPPDSRNPPPGLPKNPGRAVFSDRRTTLAELKAHMREFVEERDWSHYHTPRNVAISITLEASELLEHFQWSPPGPEEISPEKRQEICDEMADILAYLLSLANTMEIDLAAELERKMHKNRAKYPVEQVRGHWKKRKA